MQNNLNVSHLTCPLALLQVKRWLASCLPQQKVQLLVPKGTLNKDILRFIDLSEHQIIMQNEQAEGLQLLILIKPNSILNPPLNANLYSNGNDDV